MKVCKNRFCLKEHPDYVYKFCKTEECGCTLVPCKNVNHCKAAFQPIFIQNQTVSLQMELVMNVVYSILLF